MKAETEEEKKGDAVEEATTPLKALTLRHHSHIVELVAADAGAKPEDIVDFELVLFDTQKACLGGLMNEFLFGARFDNLGMTYCSVMGLIESLKDASTLEDESTIRMMATFDHEEIGSTSAQGADSSMLPAVIRRLSVLPASTESDSEKSYDKAVDADTATAYEQTLASSFLISADMAHSVNPNYGGKHETDHRPMMNQGPVLKVNANQRYATNSPGIVLLQEVAAKASKMSDEDVNHVPLQLLIMKNDSPCGSTIGPMLSAALGARTLDLGNAQLSMHSIRETAGSADVHHAIRLFKSFYENYAALEKTIFVD